MKQERVSLALAPGEISGFGVVQLAFRRVQLEGSHPFTQVVKIFRPVQLSDVLDASWTIVSHVAESTLSAVLAERDGVWVYTTTTVMTTVECAAATMDGAASVAAEFAERMNAVSVEWDACMTKVRMWNRQGRGSTGIQRSLGTDPWEAIEGNYGRTAKSGLQALMGVGRESLPAGRLVLWHGAPGTGKTAAIRALMHEWREWCTSHVVVDAEAFFADPAYVLEVVTSGEPNGWKLIIAEDCDDYLVPQSGAGVRGPLSQLLNLTDGLFGQGSNAIVLLTTNAPVDRIHPAITRPGRCLSNIEFTQLSAEEVAERTGGLTKMPMTLADVYNLLATGSVPRSSDLAYGYA